MSRPRRFQSLLWWIGRVNAWHLQRGLAPPGFNPCCGGSVASTAIRTSDRRVDAPRVSILVVVDRSRQHWQDGEGVPTKRCFNPCCGGLVASTAVQPDRRRVEIARFQSLLWWIGRVNGLPRWRYRGRHRVSILVVVDWSRQRRRSDVVRDAARVSILVVVDRSRQRRLDVRPAGTSGFNPCCGGSVASTLARCQRRIAAGFNPCCGGSVASTPERPGRLSGRGFNPCCGGLVAST